MTSSDIPLLLEKIKKENVDHYKIVVALRELVANIHPKVSEKIMYGGIMFFSSESWGGVFVSKKHVSFEFSQGVFLDDPESFLEGSGKFRRHLEIKTIEDIDNLGVSTFVKQISKT